MAIKSDKWIRKMAEEKDMISPFEPKNGEGFGWAKNCILWDIKLWL
jgi:deoxycytidine triphosphate deaminase